MSIDTSSAEKKLLVIGYVWPEPNSSAAGKHMMSLLAFFSASGYVITYASPALRSDHKADLAALHYQEVEIALNCSSFDDFVVELSPDIVLFDRFMMEEQFGWRVAKACPNAIRILDTEDLHFLRDARHQAFKKQIPMNDSLLKNDMALREIAAIYRCDLSLIISDYEMEILQAQFNIPSALLVYCPFIVEQPAESPSLTFEQRAHFVSIGNFRHAPNWDAVLYLKNTIWPLIRTQLPEAELHVYGAYPPPKATQLHAPKQGFFVDGWVDDALSMLSQARVCLAPLRFGAGLKGKLADAMLCKTPSVTSTIGSQGMVGEMDWPGAIEDDPSAFADQAVKLYVDQNSWQQASLRAQPLLDTRFNADAILMRLAHSISDISENLSQHRLANFTGMMLQHHFHKSTQYMSQWIEAKNARKT
ncbi:glycosyltransferase [Aliiglaciecola litoralis]|uniref:Glycosyltransferase family 4 protein n=1 Tax=Aliiglaciecola litoralis TaxID=582857 RepID=A0ABP3WYD3_9ALTE